MPVRLVDAFESGRATKAHLLVGDHVYIRDHRALHPERIEPVFIKKEPPGDIEFLSSYRRKVLIGVQEAFRLGQAMKIAYHEIRLYRMNVFEAAFRNCGKVTDGPKKRTPIPDVLRRKSEQGRRFELAERFFDRGGIIEHE